MQISFYPNALQNVQLIIPVPAVNPVKQRVMPAATTLEMDSDNDSDAELTAETLGTLMELFEVVVAQLAQVLAARD